MPEPLHVRFELLPRQAQPQSCPAPAALTPQPRPLPGTKRGSREPPGHMGLPTLTREKQPSSLCFGFVFASPSAHLVAPTAVDSGPPSLCSPEAFAVGTPRRWSSNGNKGQLARQQAGVTLRCPPRKQSFFFSFKNKYIYTYTHIYIYFFM